MPNVFQTLGAVPVMQTIQDMLQRQANLERTQVSTQILGQQSQLMQQQVQSEKKFNEGLANLDAAKNAKQTSDALNSGVPQDFAPFAGTEAGKPIIDGYKSETQAAKQARDLAGIAAQAGDFKKQKQFEQEAEAASGRARQWYNDGLTLAQNQRKELASVASSYADDGSNNDEVVDAIKRLNPKALQGPQFNRDTQGNVVAGPRTKAAFDTIAQTSMSTAEKLSAKREADRIKQDAIRNEMNDKKERERERMDDVRVGAIQHGMAVQDKRLSIALGETAGAVPSKDANLHGDDYLATLPSAVGAEVKAIAEGRQNISAMGYRGAARSAMMERVNQYDPNYDQSQWVARSATRRDFASGQAAKNITSINTAIGHLGTMDELATAMKNKDVPKINAVLNSMATNLGDPRINNYQLAATAVSDEMMRVFRQVGASDAEAARWEKAFKSDLSTGQLKGSMGVAVKLLGSRAEALHDQWTNTMGDVVKAPEVIHPRSKEVLKQLGVQLKIGGDTATAPVKAATKEQVESRHIKYEPDTYDYGVDENGNLMRKKK